MPASSSDLPRSTRDRSKVAFGDLGAFSAVADATAVCALPLRRRLRACLVT
ncbi:hypothetical protein D3C87_2050790 [compost metagenome]